MKIVLGFILALIGCGLFLAWGFFRPADPAADPVVYASVLGTGLVSASVIGALAFFPAVIAIVVSEAGKFRGIVFHLAASGAIAFLLWTFGGEGTGEGLRPGSSVAVASGFIAGLIYWVIAGRTAGTWSGKSGADASAHGE